MNRKVIIQASSNSKGNTNAVVNYINKFEEFDIIDLKKMNIGHFEYDFANYQDDFLPLMEKVISNYDIIIFATPVYWYSMSGILKVFFDRLSDLLNYKKELGRQLRGKKMGMISNSNENDRFTWFPNPFIESAKYLGMNYIGDVHAWFNGNKIDEGAKEIINTFRKKIHTL